MANGEWRIANRKWANGQMRIWRKTMKSSQVFWILAITIVVAVVGCKKAEPTPVADTGARPVGPVAGPEGSLAGVNGLALGTLRLEGSEGAVTPAQAAELLPLWQMIGGGSLQGDAETQAVLKQIEGKMTESQLAAIEAMELTWQDMQAWMEEQGVEMPTPPSGQGGPGVFQDLPEDERARMREEFQNMSPEQRATRMAEMGIQRPEGQEGAPGARANRGGAGRFNVLLDPLIELLTARAAK
jgi:hypothetical protein